MSEFDSEYENGGGDDEQSEVALRFDVPDEWAIGAYANNVNAARASRAS
jgi:hypothetical protein